MRLLLCCVLMLLTTICNGKDKNNVRNHFCITNDKYNDMALILKGKKDTFFLLYRNILDNGKYINEYVDDNDYAGFFTLKSIKNNQVSFRIKNYRDEYHKYTVRLTFMDDGKKCVWEILTKEPVGYLPKNAIFRHCK